MSFSAEIKEELIKIEEMPDCCAHAMTYGMLLFGRNFDSKDISLLTDNSAVGKKYALMTERVCGIMPDIQISDAGKMTCEIRDESDIEKVLSCFSTTGNERVKRIDRGNLLNECCEGDDGMSCCNAAFLRGAFLSCGTASDPNKSYHIEFVVPYRTLSMDLLKLLTDYGLKAKHMVRRYINVIYIKDSESVEDLLTIMGATNASLSIMGIKIYKDMRNRTNRIINFENANLLKTASAAYDQISAIEKLKEKGGFEHLSPDLKQVAELRIENEEASLREIGEMCTPALSRSAVNHRLKKLIALSDAGK
ncbi:MAG: DNA-binding protein WhiA [Ruminococcaceae bacterium]|nr:DNA-binding protein WhiA [Oscillospiraceae bacterium]